MEMLHHAVCTQLAGRSTQSVHAFGGGIGMGAGGQVHSIPGWSAWNQLCRLQAQLCVAGTSRGMLLQALAASCFSEAVKAVRGVRLPTPSTSLCVVLGAWHVRQSHSALCMASSCSSAPVWMCPQDDVALSPPTARPRLVLEYVIPAAPAATLLQLGFGWSSCVVCTPVICSPVVKKVTPAWLHQTHGLRW